jgi:hypothetical protein
VLDQSIIVDLWNERKGCSTVNDTSSEAKRPSVFNLVCEPDLFEGDFPIARALDDIVPLDWSFGELFEVVSSKSNFGLNIAHSNRHGENGFINCTRLLHFLNK